MKQQIKQLIAIAVLALPMTLCAQVKSYFGQTPALKVSGKELVDPNGRPVSLHGVMDTPSPYFNNYRWTNGQWVDIGNNGDQYEEACKNYFDKVFSAITDKSQGAYCNLFRLHLDPCWTNDPSKTATAGGGENDISRFSADRLRKYLNSLYIPIAENAVKHGLYVIIRPPGVFPETVTVGGEYNQYLLTVWDIVSQNATLKQYSGQISLELGNEPVNMNGSLVDYFQPIVNKIRSNGFDGILWLPGTGWQSNYTDYTAKTLSDPKSNYGFAVHNYPGWYGGWNASQTQAEFISTFESQVPVVDTHPIVITEVDWSPMKQGAGHWNEAGTQYTEGNFGTWGTGTTYQAPTNIAYPNTQNSNWGIRFKTLVDKHTNISWTLQGTTTYVDMDKYIASGTVQPAFLDAMKAAGYSDAYQACSGACFGWYYEYACGDRVPMNYAGSTNTGSTTTDTSSTTTTNNVVSTAESTTTIQISVNGLDRKFIMHVPAGMQENAPLLISFHGFGQSGEYQMNTTDWNTYSNDNKFVVVYPEYDSGFWDVYGDKDVNFTKSIIDYVYSKYKINKNRVYASGFSLGAMMTYHLINKMADQIAAFAPVSGVRFDNQSPTGSRHVPLIHHHGSADDVFKFTGDPTHAAGGYPAITDYVQSWATWNGCDMTQSNVTKYNNDTRTEWTNWYEGVKTVYCVIDGAGHWHSNSTWGGIHTTQQIWNFVKRYSINGDIRHLCTSISPYEGNTAVTAGTVFTLTMSENVFAKNVTATLEGNNQTITLTNQTSDDLTTQVKLAIPSDANLTSGVYQLNIREIRILSDGIKGSLSFTYPIAGGSNTNTGSNTGNNTSAADEIGFGSAHYDAANGRYYFRGPNNSWFEFDNLSGKKVIDCAEMTITCGNGSTTGYRLDLRMKDANGNIITDGTDSNQHYYLGTEDAGTRSEEPVLSKTYALQDLLSYYIDKYPGCTFDKIRLNTAVPYGKSDSEYQNNYWFTLSGIAVNEAHATATAGNSTDITTLAFAEYNMPGSANKVSEYNTYSYEHNIGSSASQASNGGTIYGIWSVNSTDFVDISAYKTLTLTGSSSDNSSVRVILNRAAGNGAFTEIVVGANATIDLSQYEYAHLNCIKANWGKNAKLTSAVLTDKNGNTTNLTSLPFCSWTLLTAGKVGDITDNCYNLGNSASSGAEIAGAALRGMVLYNQYADLTGYTRMVIKGEGGTLRVMMNRTAGNDWVEIRPSLENGEATIDLTPYEYVHLNSIKADWGNTVTVNAITLYNDNSEYADYYLRGAGYAEGSFLGAMWDSKARIIDATAMTNKVDKACLSANPNCLFIQTSSNAIAGTKNLVTKNGSSYSASNIALEDGNPFYAPFDIAASYVSYTRQLSNEWATVTLPFATTAGNGADMYTISGVSNGVISLARIQTGTFIAANTPIIYRKQGAGTLKLEGNNILKTVGGYNVQSSGVSDWYLCQTMVEAVIDINSDPVLKNYDVYDLSNGQFTHLTGKQTTKVFGAYILHKKNGSARSSYSINISSSAIAPDATAIEQTEAAGAEVTEVARYNSAGQPITAPVKGLNIIRMSDGTVRKVMVK